MPLIGGLLDAYEILPNDEKAGIEIDMPSLYRHLELISRVMAHPEHDPEDY
jgi:hypothetical protein